MPQPAIRPDKQPAPLEAALAPTLTGDSAELASPGDSPVHDLHDLLLAAYPIDATTTNRSIKRLTAANAAIILSLAAGFWAAIAAVSYLVTS